jgi:hypothetical protein
MSVAARAVEDKARGEQPSRMRSLATAAAAGMAVAVVVYRLLRS